MYQNLLPIGSIVRLKDGTRNVMICGRRSTQMEVPTVWLILALLAMGLILLLAAGLIGLSHRRNLARCTQRTVAVVEQVRREVSHSVGSRKRSVFWYPVFSYQANGERLVRKSNFGRGKPLFQVGQRVTLWFDPSDPYRIYVPDDGTGKWLKYLLRIIGILFIGFAAVTAYLAYAGVL